MSLTREQEEHIVDRLMNSLLAFPVESLLPEEVALISWSSAVLNVQVPATLLFLPPLPSPLMRFSCCSSFSCSSTYVPRRGLSLLGGCFKASTFIWPAWTQISVARRISFFSPASWRAGWTPAEVC